MTKNIRPFSLRKMQQFSQNIPSLLLFFSFFFLVHSKIGKPIFFSNITSFRSWKFFQQSLKRSSFIQYPSKLKNVNSWTKYLWTFSFPFTTSITELGYYHQKVNIRVASRVAERLKKWSYEINKFQENPLKCLKLKVNTQRATQKFNEKQNDKKHMWAGCRSRHRFKYQI